MVIKMGEVMTSLKYLVLLYDIQPCRMLQYLLSNRASFLLRTSRVLGLRGRASDTLVLLVLPMAAPVTASSLIEGEGGREAGGGEEVKESRNSYTLLRKMRLLNYVG